MIAWLLAGAVSGSMPMAATCSACTLHVSLDRAGAGCLEQRLRPLIEAEDPLVVASSVGCDKPQKGDAVRLEEQPRLVGADMSSTTAGGPHAVVLTLPYARCLYAKLKAWPKAAARFEWDLGAC